MADAKDRLLSEITSELSERFDYSELKEITKILLLKMEDYNVEVKCTSIAVINPEGRPLSIFLEVSFLL